MYMKLTLLAKSTFKTYIFCQYYWSFYCKFYFFINKTDPLNIIYLSQSTYLCIIPVFLAIMGCVVVLLARRMMTSAAGSIHQSGAPIMYED